MKKLEFVKHLRIKGCTLKRQGANHEVWEHPKNKTWSTVPRHKEIKRTLCIKICKDLGILSPF
jgi:mRNA interferase HicA